MKSITGISSFFLACLFLLSCSSSPEVILPEDIAAMENIAVFSSAEVPENEIKFERITAFGDTEDFFINQMGGIAVDDYGRVFLADGAEGLIHVYEEDGTYIRTIGGKGEGPGEFSNAGTPVLRNGMLYVMDGVQRRITAFNAIDYSLEFTVSLGGIQQGMGGFPRQFIPLEDGNFFMMSSSMTRDGENFTMNHETSIIDREGKKLQEGMFELLPDIMTMIQSGQGAIQIMSMPFNPATVLRNGPDDLIYWGTTDRLLITVSDMDGNYLRSIYYDQPNPPLDRRAILDRYSENENLQEALRKQEMPDVMPVFSNFFADDEGRIWISIVNNDPDTAEWWILNAEGERLGIFELQSGKTIQAIKNEYLYTREENETGLIETVKYRFNFR